MAPPPGLARIAAVSRRQGRQGRGVGHRRGGRGSRGPRASRSDQVGDVRRRGPGPRRAHRPGDARGRRGAPVAEQGSGLVDRGRAEPGEHRRAARPPTATGSASPPRPRRSRRPRRARAATSKPPGVRVVEHPGRVAVGEPDRHELVVGELQQPGERDQPAAHVVGGHPLALVHQVVLERGPGVLQDRAHLHLDGRSGSLRRPGRAPRGPPHGSGAGSAGSGSPVRRAAVARWSDISSTT